MITSTEIPSKALRFSVHSDSDEAGRAWLYLIRNNLHERPYGLLEDVWVAPDSRNQGHATALVQAVIECAQKEGCYKLIATSRFEREKVHKLYTELGFTSHGYEFRMDF